MPRHLKGRPFKGLLTLLCALLLGTALAGETNGTNLTGPTVDGETNTGN